MYHGRHFVRHLGICNQIGVKLLQLMCAVITHNSVKKGSLYINKWLSYCQLVFHGRHFVRHPICVKLLQIMSSIGMPILAHNGKIMFFIKTSDNFLLNKFHKELSL